MRSFGRLLLMAAMLVLSCPSALTKDRKIRMDDYRDKVKAAWIGKMAGVGWGITTEFRYSHSIVPDSLVYDWSEGMVNEGFNQDDIYLSAFCLGLMDRYGLHVDARRATIERQNIEFEYGRRNRLVAEEGIAPPDLAHPVYKRTSDGCGYTCGADYAGIVAPGLPYVPVHYGDVFGSGIGYGDGIYGGVFLGAMYCEAFFTSDIVRIISEALKSIPERSLVYQAVSDVLAWYRSDMKKDWKATWQKIMDKYWWNEENNWTEWPYGGRCKGINLDSKSMCAFTVMSLLYGDNDLEKTMRIAVQASEDADCDASIAGGILCTALGMDGIDGKFYAALDHGMKIKYLPYTFDGLLDLTEKIARRVIPHWGGRIETDGGVEYIVVPESVLDNNGEKCFSSRFPEPLSGARFTEDELDGLELISDAGFENQSSAWSFFMDNGANHILPVKYSGCIEGGFRKCSRTGLADAYLSLWYQNGYRRSGSKMSVGLRQTIPVKCGCGYRLSCWVKTEGGEAFRKKGRLAVRTLDGRVLEEVFFGDKPEWTKVGLAFEAASESEVVVEAGFTGVNETELSCRFDDFSMKKIK